MDGGSSPHDNCYALQVSRDSGYPAGGSPGLRIARNWVTNFGTSGISATSAPGAVIENNVVVANGANGTWAIIAPQAAFSGDPAMSDVTIRGNTVYYAPGRTGGYAIWSGVEGTGHIIANNSVYMPSGGNCFTTALSAGAYAFVGSNACYGGSWSTTCDATTHITGNPLYVAAPGDLTPQAASPLKGAGAAAYAPASDFTQKTRPNPPSIGAFER